MQVSAKPAEVIPAEAVLVPPVIHGDYVSRENEQKRRQRSEFVDPHSLLELHPLLDLGGIVPGTPALQVNDHDAGVEVAGGAAGEGEGEGGVGPEGWGEVGAEVGVAVFGGGEDGVVVVSEGGGGEFCDVVDENEVGVQVDDFEDAGGEEVGEVVAGVVEGAVQGGADGGGDEAGDGGGVVEGVDLEFEVGEGGGEGAVEEGGGGGGDEVEDDVFGAGGMLEDGEDGGHGAAEVGYVQGHGHVDCLVGTRVGG